MHHMTGLSKRLSLVSALALTVSAGLAHAADMPADQAPIYSAVPAANWSGFYAGSLIGYGWSSFEMEAGGDEGDSDVDGMTGGGVIGYNWQSGNFVFGLEGDITLHEIRGTSEATGGGIPAMDTDTLYSAHFRGRLGYDMGRFLPYIAGGFAANESYLRVDGGPETVGDNQRLNGWTIGAGVDVKLGNTFVGPLMLRAEYLYEDFGSEEMFGGEFSGVSQSTHFARIGVISYLGGDEAPSTPDGTVDWSGAYGGLLVGYGRMNVQTTDPDLEADGALGGIYTGRNFQFGNVVVGFDSALALSNFEGEGDQPGADEPVNFRNYIQGDARGRLGYAVGSFLPFVSGGISWTRSEQSEGEDDTPQRGRIADMLWTVGAGVDYRISDRISVRGEYIYGQSLDTNSVTLDGTFDQETELHEVRFGTAYHF
jgi:outer membrane immunogenic protein